MMFTILSARSYLSILLVALLVIPAELAAQNVAAQPSPVAAVRPIRNLKVVPLAGNGETNDLDRRIMAPLVVQVRDQDDRPVDGADVVFRFPPSGPGAVFAGQKYSLKVRSNDDGQAAAVGWAANKETGSFEVHVTATYGEQIGESTLTMINVTDATRVVKKPKHWYSSRWVKLGLLAGAAGAAAGIVLATRGSTPTVTISPGSPTIGGPH